MKEEKVKIGKTNLNYKIFEEKNNIENILILHGWGGSSDSWIKVGELLFENGYNVIIPDLPGFGKTNLKEEYNLEKYAKIVEDFTKKLKLKNIILWGHSNGGAISITLENRGNLNIKRLVLNNSAGIRNDKKRNFKRNILNKVSKAVKKIPFFNKNNKFIKTIRKLFYKIIGGSDYIYAENNPHMKKTYLNMISSDLCNQIKEIKTNTLLIWGENDTYTPISDGKKMRENIKRSKIVTLENEKHGIHLSSPEKLVLTFINNI